MKWYLNTQHQPAANIRSLVSPYRDNLSHWTDLTLCLHFRSGTRHQLQDQHLHTEREWTQCTFHTHCHYRYPVISVKYSALWDMGVLCEISWWYLHWRQKTSLFKKMTFVDSSFLSTKYLTSLVLSLFSLTKYNIWICCSKQDLVRQFLLEIYFFVCLFQPNRWSSHQPTSASPPWTPKASLSPGSPPAVQGLLGIMSPMRKLGVCHENLSPDPMPARAMPLLMVGMEHEISCAHTNWTCMLIQTIFCLFAVFGRRSETRNRICHQDRCPAECFEKHTPGGQSQNTWVHPSATSRSDNLYLWILF